MGVTFSRGLEAAGQIVGPFFPEGWLFSSDLLNMAERIEFRQLTAGARALTALIDLASIGLLFLIGRWMYGPTVGLLAAAFLAVNVMHVQLAHFFTVDPYLTFFVLVALTFMILAVKVDSKPGRRTAFILLAGLATGLAIGSKFSAIMLILPLTLTTLWQKQWTVSRRLLMLVLAGLVAFLIFFLTNPFAILDNTCKVENAPKIGPFEMPEPLSSSCYLQNVVAQGAMVRGFRDVPFVRQYAGTTPYLYFIEMQLRWGMGPLLGLAGFVGLVWATWRVLKAGYLWWQARASRNQGANQLFAVKLGRFRVTQAEVVLLSWALPFFIFTGALDVKFMRYLQPLIPFLMLYGAAILLSIPQVTVRRIAVALVLFVTALYALLFVNMYRQPHPWIEASRWIFDNVDEGSLIISEMWDDRLPDNVLVDGEFQRRDVYNLGDVNWLSGTETSDSWEKLEENLSLIQEAEYVVLSSNRNYGVIPRLPDRYPLSSQYYNLLFNGQLGFEVAYVGTRMPNVLGFYLKPDSFTWPGLAPPDEVADYFSGLTGPNWGRFDESFTVYDQPLVIILKNEGELTLDEMTALLQGATFEAGEKEK
jgi:hypothetical protein